MLGDLDSCVSILYAQRNRRVCKIPSIAREIVCSVEDVGILSQVPTQPDRLSLMTRCGELTLRTATAPKATSMGSLFPADCIYALGLCDAAIWKPT